MLSTTNLDKTNATALRQTIWATTLAFFVPILAFIGHYGKSKPVLSIAVVAAYACLPNLIQTSATYGRVVFSGYSAGVVIVRFAAAIVSAVGAMTALSPLLEKPVVPKETESWIMFCCHYGSGLMWMVTGIIFASKSGGALSPVMPTYTTLAMLLAAWHALAGVNGSATLRVALALAVINTLPNWINALEVLAEPLTSAVRLSVACSALSLLSVFIEFTLNKPFPDSMNADAGSNYVALN